MDTIGLPLSTADQSLYRSVIRFISENDGLFARESTVTADFLDEQDMQQQFQDMSKSEEDENEACESGDEFEQIRGTATKDSEPSTSNAP
jgi:hypothetical protein